jgi:hypothetical protein
MDHYKLIYLSGLSGQWLAWFINQHKNFTQYKTYVDTNNHGASEYKSPGTHWINFKVDRIPDHETGEWWDTRDYDGSFAHYNEKIIPKYIGNNNATKNALQVIENHDMWTLSKEEIKKVVDEMQPAGVIILYIHPTDPFAKIIEARSHALFKDSAPSWKTLKSTSVITFEWYTEVYENKFFGFLHTDYNVKYIDMGRFLRCEDSEYKSLLEFIDEDPIPEWKDMVSDMIGTVYNKYIYED